LAGTWRQQLDEAIETYAAEIIDVRRQLHAYPEPSGEEFLTTGFIHRFLTEHKIDVQIGADGRGAVADSGGMAETPRIALRADIDALRIEEAGLAEYRSRVPGVMHACGHDGHTAAVAGAILGLKTAADAGVLPWPVQWRAIFQPAEETAAGALQMIERGALDGIQAILSLHVDPARPVGRVGVRYGALTAACDSLRVRVEGRGGHAARPHDAVDPIAAAAQLLSSIYLFIPRLTDSQDAVVVTIGQLFGGDNPNVIPQHAELRGTIRTLETHVREKTKSHIRQLARGVGEASGTQIRVEFEEGPQSVVNDPRLTDLLKEAAGELLGSDHVDVIPRASMGGEDFAYYLERVPGAMFRLGAAPEGSPGVPLHSPAFDLDERALIVGARVLARAAVLWSDPARQARSGGRKRHG
jgi:amidohydrolase